MSRIKSQVYFDYHGYSDQDPTARYQDDDCDFAMEHPVGDLFDDDTYWLDDEEQ